MKNALSPGVEAGRHSVADDGCWHLDEGARKIVGRI